MERIFAGDMHCHSFYSDGSDSPGMIVREASFAGCRFLCLTDHDTCLGQEEFIGACLSHGIAFMTGIEITCLWNNVYAHILGFNYDLKKMQGCQFLFKPAWDEVEEFSEKLIDIMLAPINLRASPEDVKSFFNLPGQYASFHHVIEYCAILRNQFFNELRDEVFQMATHDWTNKQKQPIISPAKAVGIINAAGGVAVLAHPEVLFLKSGYGREETDRALNILLDELQSAGLFGIEAYYAKNSPELTEKHLRIAGQRGLFATCGSDWHGRYGGNGLGAEGLSYDDFLAFKDAAQAASKGANHA